MTIYLPELTADKSFFPDISSALQDPDGLLAIGGDLSAERIITAYSKGIFPWFSEGEPILWWSPSTRAVIKPTCCHISKSMKRLLKKHPFTVTINHAFAQVIRHCAERREAQSETWITNSMIDAYSRLHQQGVAHSLEVWQAGKLVGGLYGICIGSLFCGESMFSKVSNSSKVAFIALNQHLSRFQGTLIDCQMPTAHLASLGVKTLPRQAFIEFLQTARDAKLKAGCWDKQQILVKANMAESG